jgi:L-ascorbate metabolism protein UlaG (beta-lactamase superfamily)
MQHPISFCRGAQIRPINVNDQICLGVQPFIQDILDHFVECQDLSQSILQAADRHKEIAEQLFEFDTTSVETTFTLKEEFLFPEPNALLGFTYTNARYPSFLNKSGSKSIKDPAILPKLQQLLCLCGQSNLTYEQICQQIDPSLVPMLDRWIQCSIVKEQAPITAKIDSQTPGVYRLQHASVLYRSKTTGILVDPHLHSNYGISKLKTDIWRSHLEGLVDGILISHPHYDHWHYPTLMMFPRETPIFVPKVPRGSIMCEDMAGRLAELGFTNVIAVDWWSEPLRVGDIDIHVLPFYGEQPLVPEFNQPIHTDLRNWGNTYLLETDSYKSWLLIDSGQDPMGSMVDVAAEVKQKFGAIDLIISNFQPLSYNSIGTDLSAWGIDIVANLLSNPRIFSVTNQPEGGYVALLGPTGVAELCAIVNAKACLPYADSWAEIGEATSQDAELCIEVTTALQARQATTQVVPWKIGEGYLLNTANQWHLKLDNWNFEEN